MRYIFNAVSLHYFQFFSQEYEVKFFFKFMLCSYNKNVDIFFIVVTDYGYKTIIIFFHSTLMFLLIYNEDLRH